uniref:Ig-like domain-containing protein n=1 Tax=Poecilia formosa TaxID=48698 RepID=A0A087XR33_POEFO
SVILHPSWPQIYRGETVILRCQIQEAGGAQWTYEWKTTNRKSLIPCEYMNFSATEAHSGEYRCRGKREMKFTPWSEVIKLIVSSPPQPVLSVSPSWLNPGASVTLSCEGLEHQPAGWRFYWYKAVPKLISSTYSLELLPGSTNGRFVCRAGRGEPEFYTYYSEPKFYTNKRFQKFTSLKTQHWKEKPSNVSFTLWDNKQDLLWILSTHTADKRKAKEVSMQEIKSATKFRVKDEKTVSSWVVYFALEALKYPRPAASLSVNPDRVQHFRSESVTLSCEGNSAEWRVMRFIETGKLSYCSIWGTGSTCTIDPHRHHSGVYWCESQSGETSNAINITV